MPEDKKIKIGLTMGDFSRIWKSGLHQNTVFLAQLLQNCGFDVSLIVQEREETKEIDSAFGIKMRKFPDKKITPALMEQDVVLFISFHAGTKVLKKLRENNIKSVMIDYGNLFNIFNEGIIKSFSEEMGHEFVRYRECDQIWTSPHYERNVPWYKAFSGKEVSICPYLWDPMFFDLKCESFDGDPKWSPDKNVKNIAIHEPNINCQKTCVIPLAIVGGLNEKRPDLVENVFTLNTKKFTKSESFVDYIKSLGLLKKGSFDSRRSTPFMVCHGVSGTSVLNHIHNDLNYLHLELFRLGYPVVHNSEFFKKCGYFYPDIDVDEGIAQLEKAIETHAENVDEQIKLSEELLFKYSIQNEDNIEGYKRLIEKLLDS